MNRKAAIYHFTNKSEKRPVVYQKQLASLRDYAAFLGYSNPDVYCDMSMIRSNRTEFDRFLSNCSQYEALIVVDFYHIAKNTGKCLEIMKHLSGQGVQIHTMRNGTFVWEDPPLNEPRRVATYTCHFGTANEMKEIIPVKNDIFTLFVEKKTAWTIIDQYYDESLHQNNGEQIHLKELIQNRNKYDLLLVHNLNDLHWRTANVCRIREQLKTDIYSMQEGFLKYQENA